MTLYNNTQIQLDPWDAIKALFGRTIHLSTQIEVDKEVDVVSTKQQITIDPLIPRKHKGEGQLISTNQYEI